MILFLISSKKFVIFHCTSQEFFSAGSDASVKTYRAISRVIQENFTNEKSTSDENVIKKLRLRYVDDQLQERYACVVAPMEPQRSGRGIFLCEIRSAVMSTKEGKEKYDETLKELLANRQFLARILKRFVWEFAEYPLEEIEEQYIEPGSVLVSKVGQTVSLSKSISRLWSQRFNWGTRVIFSLRKDPTNTKVISPVQSIVRK